MFPRRLAFSLTAVLLLGVGLAWLSTEKIPHRPPLGELAPGECYALDVTANGTLFDLDFQPNSRYVLIVSSLGDAAGTYEVALEAEPAADAVLLPARRLLPFRPKELAQETRSPAPRSVKGKPTAASREGVRDFFLHVTDGPLEDPKQYARVSSRVVGEGEEVRVYLDHQEEVSHLAPGVVEEIVRLFDDEIVPRFRATLGDYRDVDGDGKFSILMTPWLSRLEGGRTSLGGFVRASDFRRDLPPPLSNRCDMLYLNSNVRAGRHLHTLLVHEFAHAVCFSERLPSERNRYGLPEEEDWLNEAVAHLAENLHGTGWSNLDHRVSRFLDAPHQYPLVVGDYYRAGLWRNHGCRGATYLFLRWCVDQFGEALLGRLIRGPARGTRNLEWATGTRFDELYRRWSLAVWQSGRSRSRPFAAAGCYTSIDLQGRLGSHELSGPKLDVYDVDAGRRTIRLKGTATAFLELRCAGKAGIRRIRLRATSGTRLQVSLVPQPADPTETEWIEPPRLASRRADALAETAKQPVLRNEIKSGIDR